MTSLRIAIVYAHPLRYVAPALVCKKRFMSVFVEDVACVCFVGHVGEVFARAVGKDCLAAALEVGKVVDHERAEEGGAVGEGWLVDDYVGALGFDALHHALNRRLAEVVAVALHRQAVNADGGWLGGVGGWLLVDGGAKDTVVGVIIPTSHM